MIKKYTAFILLLLLIPFGLCACGGLSGDDPLPRIKTQGKTFYYGMPKSEVESFTKEDVEPVIGGIFQTDAFSGVFRDEQLVLVLVEGENGFTTNLDIDSKDTRESVVKTLGEPQEESDLLSSYYYALDNDGALVSISNSQIKDMHPDDRNTVYAVTFDYADDGTIDCISFGDYIACKYAK